MLGENCLKRNAHESAKKGKIAAIEKFDLAFQETNFFFLTANLSHKNNLIAN